MSSTTYDDFEETVLSLLNKHAPLKKKHYYIIMAPLWQKNAERKPWENLNPKIAITKRETFINISLYKKQRNYYLSMLRNTKKLYFKKLNLKEIGDGKTFCYSWWKKSCRINEKIFYNYCKKFQFESSDN